MKEVNTDLTQVLPVQNLRSTREEAKKETSPLTANLYTNLEPLKVLRKPTSQAYGKQ